MGERPKIPSPDSNNGANITVNKLWLGSSDGAGVAGADSARLSRGYRTRNVWFASYAPRRVLPSFWRTARIWKV